MTPWLAVILSLHGTPALYLAPPPRVCEIVETGRHEAPKTRQEYAGDLVRRSTAIALVTVVGFDTAQHRTLLLGVERAGTVLVQVDERLREPRDATLPDTLHIGGFETGHDDFNADTVPYIRVRSQGLLGGCVASTYIRGGHYLLLLRRWHGELTPYWAALDPVNEQVRGSDDPWVQWVRRAIQSDTTRALGP
jgi:hypothetical protein